MATTIINIHKQAGQKKDAIRINSIADIPAFLKETITIKNNQINLVCVEGNETAPLGSVIGTKNLLLLAQVGILGTSPMLLPIS